MGYRSSVMVSTTKQGYDHVCAFTKEVYAKEVSKGSVDAVDLMQMLDVLDENDDGVVFGWNDVKWYDSYADVSAVNNALDELVDLGAPVMFVRVGEDYDDNEVWLHGEVRDLYITREICF